ncbi:Immunity protein SdpI [Phycisphaerae bacterium RAS1]|nr:Immunity protein SdpI [Phycisphaerae bacterium RAS1]
MIPRIHVYAAFGLVLAALLVAAIFYPALPDPAPIHWNLSGQIDGYGPRWVAAFLGPMIGAGVVALMLALPLLGPMRSNFERFRETYGRICVLIAGMIAALSLVTLLAAAGYKFQLGANLCIVLGVMFALIGNWLSKIRRNFYVGIRTPWTLANDDVWERTHRVGGRLFVLHGLVCVVTGFFAGDLACFIVMFSGLGAVSLWSVVYSLVLYRRLGSVDHLSPRAD